MLIASEVNQSNSGQWLHRLLRSWRFWVGMSFAIGGACTVATSFSGARTDRFCDAIVLLYATACALSLGSLSKASADRATLAFSFVASLGMLAVQWSMFTSPWQFCLVVGRSGYGQFILAISLFSTSCLEKKPR